jgi:hypothetical protein
MNDTNTLQDLSVQFSQMIKKNLSQVRKLSPENQRELGKLFFDFKNKLDDLS